MPKSDTEMRQYLEDHEVKALLKVGTRMRDTLIKKVMLHTGLRVGESCALQVKDLELGRSRIRVWKDILQASDFKHTKRYKEDKQIAILLDGKKVRKFPAQIRRMKGELIKVGVKAGKSGRYVPMTNPTTIDQLTAYVEDRDREDWLWTSQKTGGRLSRRQTQTMLSEHMTKAGIPPEKCHAHVLRHTCSVRRLKSGQPLNVVQRILGHTNIKTTTIYLQLIVEDLIDASEQFPIPF